MKVLIVCNRDSNPNPFVYTLADGLIKTGIEVVCSVSEFWENWEIYDIIHLQWPDLLVRGENPPVFLSEHLHNIKKAGKPIVITCHNLQPHYVQEEQLLKVYDIAYSYADVIVHMGSISLNILSEKVPSASHVIIPHHIYDTIYQEIPSKEDAIDKLHLNKTRKYILCFGAVRSEEERKLISYIADKLRRERISVLAPSLFSFSWWNKQKHIPALKRIVQRMLFRFKHPNCAIAKGHIKDEDLPYYYAASEIALIHRHQILNSGNLPMALMMGKVVVGPLTGNIGGVLSETDNPVFTPTDNSSVLKAVNNALRLAKEGHGKRNQEYAYQNLRTDIVVKKYYQLYTKLTNVR